MMILLQTMLPWTVDHRMCETVPINPITVPCTTIIHTSTGTYFLYRENGRLAITMIFLCNLARQRLRIYLNPIYMNPYIHEPEARQWRDNLYKNLYLSWVYDILYRKKCKMVINIYIYIYKEREKVKSKERFA